MPEIKYDPSSCRFIASASSNILPILRVFILFLICILAFCVRLFAVIRFESVIHEFDPYFNFRTTRFLSENGFYEWWNWFDSASWYPLGRVVGQTLYPGLMCTAYLLHKAVHLFGFRLNIKDVCVFTAPVFSGFTAIAAYLFTKETTGRRSAGLFASIFIALSPAYMSRSVAGSYDNEAVAIFALIFCFYAYVRAINQGSLLATVFACFAYFYMVASWGGYVFITNAIAIHCLALILLGRITVKHYVVYSVFYVIGTLFCLNIPFVNFQAITSSEHLASHGVFLFLQAAFLVQGLRQYVPTPSAKTLFKFFTGSAVVAVFFLSLGLTLTGRTQWAGRSLTLLDPTYASKYIPIIASVSEHQPPTWTNYIFDLHLCSFFASAGFWVVFMLATDVSIFAGLYGLLSVYFSCVMIRLMLVLSPAFCVLAGVGLSTTLSGFIPNATDVFVLNPSSCVSKHSESDKTINAPTSFLSTMPRLFIQCIAIGTLFFLSLAFIKHGVFASAVAYSHPSIILNLHFSDGTRFIQDDFREAYYWIRKNTHKDARLMSWWDYGYQSAAMADRTVIVDNNTWNTTHIATVGLAFASPEEESYPILLKLDVDYVFVVFGGNARYTGDDINKFLWMIRIAEGPYPWVKESSFFNSNGEYSVGARASSTMKQSLLYRLSYYRFSEGPMKGYDGVRRDTIPKVLPLKHLEEVYTTENWLVRVYKVKKPEMFYAASNCTSIGTL